MFSVLLVLLWTSCLLNLVLPSINNNSFSMKRKVNGYGARRAVKEPSYSRSTHNCLRFICERKEPSLNTFCS